MFFVIWGSKGRVVEVASGSFFCPLCDTRAPYKRMRLARYFTLYFIPLFQTQNLGEYIQCQVCQQAFRPEVLWYVPPSGRLGQYDADAVIEQQAPCPAVSGPAVRSEGTRGVVEDGVHPTRQCPVCGAMTAAHADRCWSCGADLPGPSGGGDAMARVRGAADTGEDATRCCACAAPIFPEDLTCPFCGTVLKPASRGHARSHEVAPALASPPRKRTILGAAIAHPNLAGLITGVLVCVMLLAYRSADIYGAPAAVVEQAVTSGLVCGAGFSGLLWYVRRLKGRLRWGCFVPLLSVGLYVVLMATLLGPALHGVHPASSIQVNTPTAPAREAISTGIPHTPGVETPAPTAVQPTSAAPGPTPLLSTLSRISEQDATPLCEWLVKAMDTYTRLYDDTKAFTDWLESHLGDEGSLPSAAVIDEMVSRGKGFRRREQEAIAEWKTLGPHPQARHFWQTVLSTMQTDVRAWDNFMAFLESGDASKYDTFQQLSKQWEQLVAKCNSALRELADQCNAQQR